MTTRQAYLDYIFAAGENTIGYLDRSLKYWREHFDPHNTLFGYASSGGPAANREPRIQRCPKSSGIQSSGASWGSIWREE